jgi:hypothetical protein
MNNKIKPLLRCARRTNRATTKDHILAPKILDRRTHISRWSGISRPLALFAISCALGLSGVYSLLAQDQPIQLEAEIFTINGSTLEKRVVLKPYNQKFDMVGVVPGESAVVRLRFPSVLAGVTINAEPLDGAVLAAPQSGWTVNSDGTLTFYLKAGDYPGKSRVIVSCGEMEAEVSFWVRNVNDPEDLWPLLRELPIIP